MGDGPVTPRRRTPPRPYARQRKWPSVTTCNVLDKHLDWAASREAAMFAVHHFDEWHTLDVDGAVDRIRRHFRGVWDSRAAMGTLIHSVNEAWTWGESPDLLALVTAAAQPPNAVRLWQGREGEAVADANRYVNGLERFWLDWQPATVATEEVVRDPDPATGYIGQRDWVADLFGVRWLLDLKTTAQQDEEKGLYPDSWRLQLAAYRGAPEIVLYDTDGNETGTHPNYPVDRCGVVLMRGDDKYTFYEVEADVAELARFRELRSMWQWVNRDAKKPPIRPQFPPKVEQEQGGQAA